MGAWDQEHINSSKRTMKRHTLLNLATVGVMSLLFACRTKESLGDLLTTEIGSLGGRTNRLHQTANLGGKWSVSRDQFGTAIDTEGIRFDAITNLLTTAYGEPRLYSGRNERHGPVYLYPPTTAGISVFVSSTTTGAEVTLTKPQ